MSEVELSADERSAAARLIHALGSKAWEADELMELRARLKKARIAEQERRCCYCRQSFPTAHGLAWTLDHVLSRSDYPQFSYELENLAACCLDCNGAKRTYDSLTGSARRPPIRLPRASRSYTIVHPRFDNYEQHIARFAEQLYLPLSEKGAETVRVCRLYRHSERAVHSPLDPASGRAVETVDRLMRTHADDGSPIDEDRLLLEIGFVVDRANGRRLGGA